MSLDSFYGGRPSTNFTIKNSFPSIAAMETKFSEGDSYKDVWYGEYVIIDTLNKNDRDNGIVYQRGINGPIRIGQIVGPSSGTPFFDMSTIENVQDVAKETIDEAGGDIKYYPTGMADNKFVTTKNGDGFDLYTAAEYTINNHGLVPGKEVSGDDITYNDGIKYTWCNIRLNDEDKDSIFYVGFEIPYHVAEFQIHPTSPYDEDGNISEGSVTIEKIDDGTHPFYSLWDLGIPKGIKGDTLRNLKVVVPTEGQTIYLPSAISLDEDSKVILSTNVADIYDATDDIANGREIITFELYVYDEKKNPDPILIYLGDFNIIENIALTDDGTLTIGYTHEDDDVFSKKLKWINNIELTKGLGEEGGHLTVSYNNGDDPFEEDLTWIKDIQIGEDGTITYSYVGTDEGNIPDNGIKLADHLLRWIANTTLNNENGKFTVNYNNGNPDEFTLDWVKDIAIDSDGTVTINHVSAPDVIYEQLIKSIDTIILDSDTGIFSIKLNSDTAAKEYQLDWIKDIDINETNGNISLEHTDASVGTVLSDAKLKIITKAETAANGITTLTFNTGDTLNLKLPNSNEDFKFKTITDVILNTNIREDQRIRVRYNTDTTETNYIGNPINYVQELYVRPSDWHLFVLFSDPAHRVPKDTTEAAKWITGNNLLGYTGNYNTEFYNWYDLGAIKDQSGLLIGFNITNETLGVTSATKENIITWLNNNYANGLTGNNNVPGGQSLAGKIITYSPTDTDQKDFFAFDYNRNTWYWLGDISDSGIRDAMLYVPTEGGKTPLEMAADISINGVLFQSVNIESVANIPDYWAPEYEWK